MFFALILTGIVGFLSYKWAVKYFNFFEKQGIKYVKPYPFIGTNFWLYPRKNIALFVNDFYNRFSHEKIYGLFDFRIPFYVIRDPDLLKHLTVKEFEYFPNHTKFIDKSHDKLFGSMLTTLRNKEWKEMRSALSPIFTGSKMRQMFDLMSEVGQMMTQFFWEEYTHKGPISYDVKKVFSQFTNDVIATCAFGMQCDSFRHPENEFFEIGQKFVNFQKSTAIFRFLFIKFFPVLAKAINLKVFSKESTDLFHRMIIDNMNNREKEKIYRPDLIQLLMQVRKGELNNKENQEDTAENDSIAAVNEHGHSGNTKTTWNDTEIIAQCFLFFMAGFETSSSTMRWLTYELAVNPDIQEKLVSEIDELHESLDGKPLTYENIQSLKYLDMIVSETLRKWPAAYITDRQCERDFTYQDDSGLKFEVKKDMYVFVPIYALHMDPKYYPNPEKFDPERFSEENKHNINFNAYLPFGIGPRNCIGSRFALLEIKIAIYHLMRKFTFEVCEETLVPMTLRKTLVGILPEREIQLCFKPRSFE